MKLDFSNAIRMIIAKGIKVEGSETDIEACYFKETLKELKNYGYEDIPEIFLVLLVLERMKSNGVVDHSRNMTLRRNLTYEEIKFLSDNNVSYYFGDFEVLDEEYIIQDFTNMLYVLYFDISKNFLYGKALKFNFVPMIKTESESMYAS